MPIPSTIADILIKAHRQGLIPLSRPSGYKGPAHRLARSAYLASYGSGDSKRHETIVWQLQRLGFSFPIPLGDYQLTPADVPDLLLLRDAIASKYKSKGWRNDAARNDWEQWVKDNTRLEGL